MAQQLHTSTEAPAKINLGLHVLQRRTDGYHEIETGLVAIDWFDRITVGPAASLSMSCSDPTLPIDSTNLCMKAANLLREVTGSHSGAHIHLEKNVPYGAGLGSGSSDAAATLVLLNTLWKTDLRTGKLQALAAQIGSDVAFFITAQPAIGGGRGEHLSPLSLPDDLYSATICVVTPEIHISTAEAYGSIAPSGNRAPGLRHVIESLSPSEWRQSLVNDFEPTVLEQYPALQTIKDQLYGAGADYVSLSGSGSAVYGLFAMESTARRALRACGHSGWTGSLRLPGNPTAA